MVWIGFFFASLAFVFMCAFRSRANIIFSFLYVVFCTCIFTSVYVNGIDWVNYYYVFDDFKSSFSIRYDLFFNLYLYLLAHLSGSFAVTISLFYLIAFYVGFRALKSSPLNVNIPAALFSLILLGGMALVLDQIRQFAAIVICFYSISYVLEKKLKLFIISVLVASLFHYSAIIAFVFWYAYYSGRKSLIVKCAWLTGCMIFLGGVILTNPSLLYSVPVVGAELARKASLYSDSMSGSGFGVGVVADLALIACFFLRNKNDEYSGIWKITFFFACLHIGIYFIPAFSRFYYYLFIPLSIMFGHILTCSRLSVSKLDSLTVLFVVALISFIVTFKAFDDEKRPALMDYQTDWILGNDRYLDTLRYERCEKMNSLIDAFCTQ